MKPLVWLHGDSLSPTDPAAQAFPSAPRVFVFDEPFLVQKQLAFQRLFFLYECALEAATEIRRGDVVLELKAALAAHQCRRIVVTESPAPEFEAVIRRLRETVPVEVIPAPALVKVPPKAHPARFSAFWRRYGQEWS